MAVPIVQNANYASYLKVAGRLGGSPDSFVLIIMLLMIILVT